VEFDLSLNISGWSEVSARLFGEGAGAGKLQGLCMALVGEVLNLSVFDLAPTEAVQVGSS